MNLGRHQGARVMLPVGPDKVEIQISNNLATRRNSAFLEILRYFVGKVA